MVAPSAPAAGRPGARLPAVHPDDALELAEHLRRMADRRVEAGATASAHVTAIDLVVPFVEALLECAPDDVEPAVLAEFVTLTRPPGMVETIALQAAFGRGAGEYQARRLQRRTARTRTRSLSIAADLAHAASAGAAAHDLSVRLFLGDTRRRPNDDRMRRLVALARRTASLLPPTDRIDLLCLLGWLLWAQGQPAPALTHLSDALRIDTAHPLAAALVRVVGSGSPAWRPERGTAGGDGVDAPR